MMCQICSSNPASTHIKTIVNGKLTEYVLCTECAQKMGYNNLITGFGTNFGEFLSGFLGEISSNDSKLEVKRCKQCGSSFNDISKNGKIGCAQCYSIFHDELMPIIKRIHGNTIHTGEPNKELKNNNFINKTQKLKENLKIAIERQEFERAAEIRDTIKSLERGEKQ